MIALLATAFSLSIGIGEPWALPHTGQALNQNELTYFHDCAIVKVEEALSVPIQRDVTTPQGKFHVDCRQQDVKVVASNFGAGDDLKLIFTPHMPYTQRDFAPGQIELPLLPGTYFVMGLNAQARTLRNYPGFTAYGANDENVDPPVPVLTLPAESANEFAVFDVFKTEAQGLAGTGVDPAMVLRDIVHAATQADDGGFNETISLLLRTGHEAFRAWHVAAKLATSDLQHYGASVTGNREALSLAAAWHMGGDEYKFGHDQQLLTAIVQASNDDPSFWTGGDMRQQLMMLNPMNYPSPSQRAELIKPERSEWYLREFKDATCEPVRNLIMRWIGGTYARSMNPDIVEALRSLTPGAGSTKALLQRVAEWLQEPSRDPGQKTFSEEDLIAYWIDRLSQPSLSY